MNKGVCLVAGLAGALAASCVSESTEADLDDVKALVAERGVERIHWNQGTAADAQVTASVRELLQGELTADAAVQVALLNNRELQATYEDLGVAQADLVQAGLLSNPVFLAEVRFPGRPRLPFELDITQDFLDVFLRPLRQRIAEAEFEAAQLRVADAVLKLATDSRAGFYVAQGAEQMLEMRRSVVDAMDASADAAQRLYEAGNITDRDLANETVLLGQARLELAMAEEEALDAREVLTALMGLWGDDASFTLAGRLPELPEAETAAEGLETLAVTRRLDLAAARAEVEALGRRLGIEDFAALRPEVIGGLHVEREPEGTTTTGPSIELPIPLFDQGDAARARASALLRQSEQRYAALAVEIRSDVRRARNRMLSARSRAEYYRTVLLPLRGTIVEQTQLEYNGMLVGVFELLQAKQAEIDAGREYIEALQAYWVARTDLEHAVGGRLTENGEPEQPEPPAEQPPAEPQSAPDAHQHQHGGTP